MSAFKSERRSVRAHVCVAVLLLVRVTPAAAESEPVKACFDRLSNSGQRECLQELYRTTSARLDEVLRGAIERASKLEATPHLAPAISKSQIAWQAYRDAECWGVVGYDHGSAARPWVWSCLVEKTLQRIKELEVS
jgi:uncharacterized protein YecT (DUF1311 family)